MTLAGGDRHLSWERFEVLLGAGPPAIERVLGVPAVDMFTDAGGERIGLRVPAPDAELPANPLVEIRIERESFGGGEFLEVSTANRLLFREFYAFACAVADGIQLDHRDPAVAISVAVAAWGALLQSAAALSAQQQTGLLGELWVLERIARGAGWQNAIASWKGPGAEEHDFSVAAADIEVKTTMSERREHMIGSLTQLEPNLGRALYIASLQITDAGGAPGATLSERVAAVRRGLHSAFPGGDSVLNAGLAHAGWRDEHASLYSRRFALRTAVALVPVDDSCPTIVPSLLSGLGPERVARISQVAYRVNLDGLGHEDGEAPFLEILP